MRLVVMAIVMMMGHTPRRVMGMRWNWISLGDNIMITVSSAMMPVLSITATVFTQHLLHSWIPVEAGGREEWVGVAIMNTTSRRHPPRPKDYDYNANININISNKNMMVLLVTTTTVLIVTIIAG
eukprot:TRINITY_DN18755_c0_g2_i1.p2 TRINITY_DN18755_c0_g2~~TRINITY_DN18755_c0_g2_i1.p2  ORF type:complete len:125 (-),score=4.13 TRINITY_DN18755_c0_g2_i1:542-916(-)